MVVVLDTDAVDPDLRADAMEETVRMVSVPQHVVPTDDRLEARVDLWDLGTAGIYRIRATGLHFMRTMRQVRRAPSPILAVAVRQTGTMRRQFGDVRETIRQGALFVMDFNVPYEVDWHGAGEHALLMVPLDQLAIPSQMIRIGAARPQASPLYRLVTGHISELTAMADQVAGDPAAREIGSACVELVRALMASAAGSDNCDGAAVPSEILLTRIRQFIRDNLSDPRLGAPMIARAHNVSVRYLYKLCGSADLRLEQWIIQERLEQVRRELARPENSRRSISAIAGKWGFQDPSHFARRFRAAYGMRPRDWRQASVARPPTVAERE
ncbi:helix-turn-helix domain-containing protein [Nocardia sp. NPDC127526]|uniref:helix-turn-helix domain-containing protein n=1 Tax=Nocardia sp. NPDC127526 TaxID=3345393 RepID=UPI003639EB99